MQWRVMQPVEIQSESEIQDINSAYILASKISNKKKEPEPSTFHSNTQVKNHVEPGRPTNPRFCKNGDHGPNRKP
uniref:Uncharacterized protein n=1 Tax=Knipowitschia caucasica TaxID=637954 RepID=A0AAV2KYT5_KNICA